MPALRHLAFRSDSLIPCPPAASAFGSCGGGGGASPLLRPWPTRTRHARHAPSTGCRLGGPRQRTERQRLQISRFGIRRGARSTWSCPAGHSTSPRASAPDASTARSSTARILFRNGPVLRPRSATLPSHGSAVHGSAPSRDARRSVAGSEHCTHGRPTRKCASDRQRELALAPWEAPSADTPCIPGFARPGEKRDVCWLIYK